MLCYWGHWWRDRYCNKGRHNSSEWRGKIKQNIASKENEKVHKYIDLAGVNRKEHNKFKTEIASFVLWALDTVSKGLKTYINVIGIPNISGAQISIITSFARILRGVLSLIEHSTSALEFITKKWKILTGPFQERCAISCAYALYQGDQQPYYLQVFQTLLTTEKRLTGQ